MKGRVVPILLVVSIALNLVLGMLLLGSGMLQRTNQSRWRKQTQLVVNWAERIAKERRPLEEVGRFTGNGDAPEILHWGPTYGDLWTIIFESDDAGKVVGVQIDGYTPEEFRDLYTWLKE